MSNNVLKIVGEVPPSINNDYVKPRAILKRGKPMAMMYETQKAKKYKKDLVKKIKEEIENQGFIRDIGKYTVVEWTFYFPRKNMDTNNYYKCFVDSITEAKNEIWEDDNVSLMRDKNIFYDSVNPRVEVEIYYLPKIGIFEDENQLNDFIQNNCNHCKKGNKIGQKGGCAIYKKALENRVQTEIDMNELKCNKVK